MGLIKQALVCPRSFAGGMARVDQMSHPIVEHSIDSFGGPQLGRSVLAADGSSYSYIHPTILLYPLERSYSGYLTPEF